MIGERPWLSFIQPTRLLVIDMEERAEAC